MKNKKLTKTQIAKELKKLDGWKVNAKGTEISKMFLFKDFKAALRFVNKVGKFAEEANHHPDIVLSYGKVNVKLSTHSAGGLTIKDFELAKAIDGQMKK